MNQTSPNSDVAVDPYRRASLLEIGSVVLRHRRLVAAITFVLPTLVAAWILFQPRSWTATTSFTPHAATDPTGSRLAAVAGQFGFSLPTATGEESPQFYAQLIHTRPILEAIAEDVFEIRSGSDGGTELRQITLADLLEFDEGSARERLARVVKWLRERAVSVSTDIETGVVGVSVSTRWPDLSAAIANRLVDLVGTFNVETRQSEAHAERRFIEEQMQEARQELIAEEEALKQFLQNNRTFQTPQLQFEHDRLRRRVDMRQQVFTSLVQAYEQARISEVRNTPVITVIETAVEPARPDRRGLVSKSLAALIAGGFLALMVALARENYARRRQEGLRDYAEFEQSWAEAKRELRGLLRMRR